jgi:LysR family transcriptional activator of glutamate synthase operon
VVSGFRDVHPQVHPEVRQVHDDQLSTVVARGEVDFEISTVRLTEPELRWHRLMEEPLQLALPGHHRLAGRPSIVLAEVADEPFITLRPSTLLHRLLEDLCTEAGLVPAITFESDDLSTVHGFVAA